MLRRFSSSSNLVKIGIILIAIAFIVYFFCRHWLTLPKISTQLLLSWMMLTMQFRSLTAIASLSKSFTVIAALQLVEAGKINLDVSVKQYLPDFTLADTQTADQITIRHLLNHASGCV